jgi:biopolymer transport protein ExbD
MRFAPRKRRQTPPVIIVAMIDILIVVLIFMMVTTTFKRKQPAVKLALPESKEATPGASESPPLVVTVAKTEPFLFLDDLPMTSGQLQGELMTRAQKDPQLQLSIRADEKAPFGEIVKVMDAAKAAGIPLVNAFVRTGKL